LAKLSKRESPFLYNGENEDSHGKVLRKANAKLRYGGRLQFQKRPGNNPVLVRLRQACSPLIQLFFGFGSE